MRARARRGLCGPRGAGFAAATFAAAWICALPANGQVASDATGKPAAPQRYGTSAVSYTRVDAMEMTPESSAIRFYGINNLQLRFLTNVSGFGLLGQAHLPNGALVTYMELDYFDNSTAGQVVASLGECDYLGENCVYQAGTCGTTATVCSLVGSAPGYLSASADLSPNGLRIDNFFKRYVIRAGNTTNDGTTAISQVIIGYVLQVSPAPGGATFNDVPTSHPFFQYVEALTAAQITSGCGGNNFCPNAALTRGQMAVFLAKALGLQFP